MDNPLLSIRLLEVLQAASLGQDAAEIGRNLGISKRTVEAHLARARERLETYTTTHAVAKALRRGLII